MKAAKKILSLALAACMAFVLLPLSARADSPVCSIGETWYESLGAALASATDAETTITLLDDIEYDEGIVVEGKTITFDLNGYTLDVQNETGYGLEVGADGVVSFTGYDEDEDNGFYVSSDTLFSAGVYAHDGGKATVSYASGTFGVVAGNPAGGDTEGGDVTVLDSVWGGVFGIVASGANSNVTVGGGVTAGDEDDPPSSATGISVQNGATVTVGGAVEVDAEDATGIQVEAGGTVTVEGDLAVYGENIASTMYVAVKDSDVAPATVRLDGVINVFDEVFMEGYISWDGEQAGEGVRAGDYLRYTHGDSQIDVMGACWIGSDFYFSFGPAWFRTRMDSDYTTTTIKLLRNIEYGGITVEKKTVIFDLNGHELFISNDDGDGLSVGEDGVVDIIDTQEGSVLSINSVHNYGVYAHDGGRATVSVAGGQQAGVYADGEDTSIRVKIAAYSNTVGVSASGGGTVTVDGEINGTPYIALGGKSQKKGDGVPGAAPYENYLVYSDDGGNTVRVKTDAVCKLSLTTADGTYTSLHNSFESALNGMETAVGNWSATITLFEDIEYDDCILIAGGLLTFDLNGHTLTVEPHGGDGLHVSACGVVDITGGGAFNIINTDEDAAYGVRVRTGGQATVTNITATGTAGVLAEDAGSTVEVLEDVDSTTIGAIATGGATVLIHGELTVPDDGVYIRLGTGSGHIDLTPDQGAAGIGAYAGYLHYTDGTNHVYVKAFVNAALSSATATFDKKASAQADVTATVTWNSASSITDVKENDVSIGAANYSVSGNTLTIKKAYLAAKAVGDLVLTVVFDKGASATLTITVSNTASGGVTPGGDDGPAYGARTLNDAATGVSVSGGGIHGQARLTVTPVDTQSLPDALKQAAAKGALLLGFEVTLSGGFLGELTISFPVGAQYNGQTVTVLHYVNDKAEAHTAVVADGRASITVSSLSPFAVVLPAAKVPNTGGAAAAYGFALILLAALLAGYAVRRKHRA